MKRILVAVVYLFSLVTTSSAQVVGAASTRSGKKAPTSKSNQVVGAASKKSGQTAEALQSTRFDPRALDIKPDNTYVQNQASQIEQHIQAKLSQTSQAVVEDCQNVSRALGLDAFYKALRVSKEEQNKAASKDNNALTQQEAVAALKYLSIRIYQAAQQEKSPYAQEALKAQAHLLFPVFESLGALDPTAKKWEADNLRTFIRNNLKACTSGNADKCHAVLTSIRALPVLDERTEQGQDALLVSDFLEANYQSAQAASVLQTCAVGLISLGRINMLLAFIQKAEGENLGFWSRLGNVVQLEYWSEKGAEMVRGGDRWLSRANQGSYYKVKKKEGERLGNIYQDLGEWLASEKENGKYVYRNQIDLSSFLHAYENGALHVSAPAFVTGALLGGMTLPSTSNLRQMQTGYVMNGKGQVSYSDTTTAWNAVQKRLEALHTNTTGLALQELYAHPKAEMPYAQRIALNNRIIQRFDKVTPKQNGKIYRPKWMRPQQLTTTQKAVDTYFAAQNQLAQVADIGVAVIGLATGVASGFGIAKLSSFGIRTISKARYMMAIARAHKGTLTTSQLRSLAQFRMVAQNTAATATNTKTAATVGTSAKRAHRAASTRVKKKPQPVAATQGRGPTTTAATTPKRPAAQSAAASTTPAAENAGATTAENTGVSTPAAKPEPKSELKTEAVSPTQLEQQVTGPLAKQVELKKTYQTPTMENKSFFTREDVAASDVTSSNTSAGGVTIDNYLSAKRVGSKYEVQAVDEKGNIFIRQMTTDEYRRLQQQARSTGRKESLDLRGQRRQLELRRSGAVETGATTPAPAVSIPSQQLAQATQEIAAQIDSAKRMVSRSDRLVSSGSTAHTTVITAQDNVAQADALYARLTQQSQKVDVLYVEINDIQRAVKTNKVKSSAELADKTAQVAQKTKQIEDLMRQMQSTAEQLYSLEVNATVKSLGQTRVAAQRKLVQIRQLLQDAAQANIPSSQTAQLKTDLQQAENTLYATEKAGRQALSLGKEGSFSQAVDKAEAAQHQVTSALQKVEESAAQFQQLWSTKLKQAPSLTPITSKANSFAPLSHVSTVGKIDVPGVYPLLNSNGEIVAYGKVSSRSELARTRQFHQIINGGSPNLHQKYAHLEIEYPEILSEDFSKLPPVVQQKINKDLQNLAYNKNGRNELIQSGQSRTFTMSVVDTKGFSLSQRTFEPARASSLGPEIVRNYFNGKPITQTEWAEVENLVADINKAGFQHGDLMPNFFLRRNPQTGKIKATFIDFEVFSDAYSDQHVVTQMKQALMQYKALVP